MPKTKFISNWKDVFKSPALKNEFVFTLITFIITVYVFSKYLVFNETRPGAILDDPLLHYFNAVDLNPLIFFSIYSSVLLAFIAFSFNPMQLMTGFQVYILLVVFRMIAMYLTPLDPPIGSIDLQDPVVFFLGTGKQIVRDLFFSGHTSTAFMLYQVAKNKILKIYFLMSTTIVGISVVLQKAHYTIDIFVGIIFSYASYQIIKAIQKKLHKTI